MTAFLQCVGGQSERQKAMYSDIISTTQRVPLDFEWKGFVQRNNNTLIDPSMPQRSVSHISFPNQDHIATQPLISGFLERKSRAALKGYSSNYYAVTRSKYLHEFKDDDEFRKDPTPELSLYLPDCTVGGINGEKFTVKGKDASKGKVGSSLAMSHELAFKARTSSDAEKWWSIIREAAGEGNFTNSVPSSPVESRNVSAQQAPPQYQEKKQPAPLQTQDVLRTGNEGSGVTPGTGISAGDMPISGSGVSQQHMTSPASAPHSGVDRAPGQY